MDEIKVTIKKALEKIMEEYRQDVLIDRDGPFVAVYNNCSAILSVSDGDFNVKFLLEKPCAIHKEFPHEDYKEAVREMKAALLESCGNDVFEDGDEAIAVYDNAVFHYGIQDGEEIMDLYRSPVYIDYNSPIIQWHDEKRKNKEEKMSQIHMMIEKAVEKIREKYASDNAVNGDGPFIIVYNNCCAVISSGACRINFRIIKKKSCIIHKNFNTIGYMDCESMERALEENFGSSRLDEGDEAVFIYDDCAFLYSIQNGEEIFNFYCGPVYVDYTFVPDEE